MRYALLKIHTRCLVYSYQLRLLIHSCLDLASRFVSSIF